MILLADRQISLILEEFFGTAGVLSESFDLHMPVLFGAFLKNIISNIYFTASEHWIWEASAIT